MRLSVLIPSYNYADRLGHAITSVLDNAHQPHEILVVDDGSTDHSVQVARSFPEVRVICKDNGGMSSAVNVGVAESSGDVVVLLDADDEMLPGRLAWVETAFLDPEVVMAWHPLLIRDDRGATRGVLPHLPLPEGDLAPLMAAEGLPAFAVTSGLAIRRSTFSEVGPVPEDRFGNCADAFLVRTLPFSGRVRATNEPLGIYHVHAGSDSRRLAAPDRRSMVELLRRRLDMADAERDLIVSNARAAGHTPDERRILTADRVYQVMFIAHARLSAPDRSGARRSMNELRADRGIALALHKALYLMLPVGAVVQHELVRSGDPRLSRPARLWSALYWRAMALLDRRTTLRGR